MVSVAQENILFGDFHTSISQYFAKDVGQRLINWKGPHIFVAKIRY